MTRQERYTFLLDYFEQRQPEVTTELNFGSAFQLIVATLLSAQCTDERINKVTPALFAKYPDAHAMAQATEEDLLEYIRSVSYPNSKAKHLVAMAKMIENDFRGEIPDNTADLVKLPGVGRKTANVLQAVWFNKPTLAVDTHVYRVSHRLGLVPKTANTPLKVEEYLMKHIPEEKITRAHHWLLLHGRYVCNSARPKCEKCDFESFCPKLLEGSKVAKG
ncbi:MULTISPECIES: endonuclease III [Segatella]|uniref:Endonuclease III n=1 Tax=Segatella bryantii TaxID=77095 RepID=A0AA37HVK1_SEGBR|nr:MULTISPECIES: endonuclease III [Segatella]UKK78952.1 endonuclease III [Segatella baroniae B14]GJG26793.1 endonuclease III [Segatella bryantii]SEQ46870.1 DNA-(apurinic or apyrimidinic site) lyase /endonuclease III [Segatella baroniae B14]